MDAFTINLVPHVSTPKENMTLVSSVALGLHLLSSRLVLLGGTVGQVFVVVATTVIIPSVEHTITIEIIAYLWRGNILKLINLFAFYSVLPVSSSV